MTWRSTTLTGLAAIAVAAGVALALPPTTGGLAQERPGTASETLNVLELFTSQGCSACPAADRLLGELSVRPGVMALSLSVDYWDQLGWKDTLASPRNTARQHAYAKALGSGNVFTPQMIINGAAHAIGSKLPQIEAAIAKTTAKADGRVVVTAVAHGPKTVIEIGAAAKGMVADVGTVWLVRLQPRVEVEIKRGENRGKRLAYHNVVREVSAVGMWSGKAMRIELPTSAVMEPGERCAVLLQHGEVGRVLGAAWLTP